MIKILTYNIFPGRPFETCCYKRIENQSKYIKERKPDVICFQEVFCKYLQRYLINLYKNSYNPFCSSQINYYGIFLREIFYLFLSFMISFMISSLNFVYFVYLYIFLRFLLYNFSFIGWMSGHGSGLLILYNKEKYEVLDIYEKIYDWQKGDWMNFISPRRYIGLLLKCKETGKNIYIINTHLNALGEFKHRNMQLYELTMFIKNIKNIKDIQNTQNVDLISICGDFNCHYDSYEINKFIEKNELFFNYTEYTWDSENSLISFLVKDKNQTIDYIFYKTFSNNFNISSQIILNQKPLSDHYAVLSTYQEL